MTLSAMEQGLTSCTDRFKMLQEQQSLTLRDLDDVSKRNRDLYERFTAVDIECNRVTEDLVAANGKTDQLRNECANLRAEKRIWEVSVARPGNLKGLEVLNIAQSVEGRLVEENKALSMERSHLSDLMANVQKMHNDIERSSENDRRRLESQIQLLEHQRFVVFAFPLVWGLMSTAVKIRVSS